MDPSTIQRGITSLRWFLAAYADELSGDLLWALGEGHEGQRQNADELVHHIHELSPSHMAQLCSAIEGVHRSYFGTMNGRELSAFVHQIAEGNSAARYG